MLKKHVTPIADTRRYVATHGSPWDYDRRVPILFWRKSMAAMRAGRAVETVDIMPTLGRDAGRCRSAAGRSTGIASRALPAVVCPACAKHLKLRAFL